MPSNTQKTLRFITCGSVDDGKSTLIGRLLLDSKTVLQDQLESVRKKSTHAGPSDELDLAMFTDGLIAEREQGITIDVAYRYFATPKRKFIIGDAPGHEQYTRNMVTAASSADAAIVLIDATKLPLTHTPHALHTPNIQNQASSDTEDQANAADATYDASILLAQTRRHALLAQLLRVTHIIFAVNKLDAVPNPELVFKRIRLALADFAQKTKIQPSAIVPISALLGSNVVFPAPNFAGYHGPSLLSILENLPAAVEDEVEQFGFPVQWVEKSASSSDTSAARRILWGRIASGQIQVGQTVSLHPSGIQSKVARVYDHCRQSLPAGHAAQAGSSVGIVLETELDVSRGDYLLGVAEQNSNTEHLQQVQQAQNLPEHAPQDPPQHPPTPQKTVQATVAWLGNEALSTGRIYHALHGHRWVKAKVIRIIHALNIQTLETEAADTLGPNAIGAIELQLQEALPLTAYQSSKRRGALILADTANNTVAALLVQ